MNKLFMKLKGKLVDVIIISDDKNNEWKTNIRLQKRKKKIWKYCLYIRYKLKGSTFIMQWTIQFGIFVQFGLYNIWYNYSTVGYSDHCSILK